MEKIIVLVAELVIEVVKDLVNSGEEITKEAVTESIRAKFDSAASIEKEFDKILE